MPQQHTYFVQGMTCASCEVLIEKTLLKQPGIKVADASAGPGTLTLEYEGERPSAKKLNELFKDGHYIFSDSPFSKNQAANISGGFANAIIIAAVIIAGFFGLSRLGISGLVNVSASSSLPTFLALGLIAGFSTCAALVGGLLLSLSKQWSAIYAQEKSTWKQFTPYWLFNLGRLVGFTIIGLLLGALGAKLQLSAGFSAALIFVVSIIMIILGLQMLGVNAAKRLQLSLPKFIGRYIADEKNFAGKRMPFVAGALTFLLPCGFTITTEGLALLSGNAIQGALIMLFFVIGTMPALLLIGLASTKLLNSPHWSGQFTKVAGILVLFFALFNLNNQLTVLGWTGANDLLNKTNTPVATEIKGLAPIENGVQVMKMNASARGYTPNYFKIRAGMPTRWEVTDTGTSGCTNAVLARKLFDGQIDLTPGQTSVKEFTAPAAPGRYKFSCWMGMISGTIEVVDESGKSAAATPIVETANAAENTSGNGSGHTCGMSAGGACGCGAKRTQ